MHEPPLTPKPFLAEFLTGPAWPVVGFLFVLQMLLLALTAALYLLQGMSLKIPPAWALLTSVALVSAIAAWTRCSFSCQIPALSHSLLAGISMGSLALICTALSYVLYTLGFPLADVWLSKADSLLGTPVPIIVKWVQARPFLNTLSIIAYDSLWPQIFLVIVILGLWLKDFRSLWECAFHFQVTAAITVLVSTIAPSVGAYVWYGYTSSIDEKPVLKQIVALRDGTLEQVPLSHLEGIISFPSFHTVAAIVIAYSLRRHPRWFWPFLVLDIAMTLSPLTTGVHYAVDLTAASVVCLISFFIYSKWQAHRKTTLPRSQV